MSHIVCKGAITMADIINNPPHYTQGKFEVIEVIEDWKLNFHLGNVIKYIARADYKGFPILDLEKPMWYLQREIIRRSMLPAKDKL